MAYFYNAAAVFNKSLIQTQYQERQGSDYFPCIFFPFSSSPLAQSVLSAEFKKKTPSHPKKKGQPLCGHLNV